MKSARRRSPRTDVPRPFSNMAMLHLLKDMNGGAHGKPMWVDPKSGRAVTPHGFRATFRTWGEDQGHARDLLEEALGHQIGTVVEKAYRRTDSLERRRAVMQAWADHCSRTVVGRNFDRKHRQHYPGITSLHGHRSRRR